MTMKMQELDSVPRKSRGWIRRLFGRREKTTRARGRSAGSGSSSLSTSELPLHQQDKDQGTEPTADVVSFTTVAPPHCMDGSVGSFKVYDGIDLSRCNDENWKPARRTILDSVSVTESSSSHLEVRLIEPNEEANLDSYEHRVKTDGVAYRTSVMDMRDEPGEQERNGEAGAEIILNPRRHHLVNIPKPLKSQEEEHRSEAKEAHERFAQKADPSTAFGTIESRWVSEATTTSNYIATPRLSVITTTISPPDDANSHRNPKVSVAQGSDHSPTDSLTWVSHDQNCVMADTRPLKEISFTMFTNDSDREFIDFADPRAPIEPSNNCNGTSMSPETTIKSLQGNGRVRDQIFASFDAGPDVAVKSDWGSKASQDKSPIVQGGETYSHLIEWPGEKDGTCKRTESPSNILSDGPVTGDVQCKDRRLNSDESGSNGEDSTLSSILNADNPGAVTTYSQELPQEPEQGQLIQLRANELGLTSAFDPVGVVRAPSFDAGMSQLAYRALQICCEKPYSGPGDIDTIRKSRSLMDATSDGEQEENNTDNTTESPSSGSDLSRRSLPRQLSIPTVDNAGKMGAPEAPRLLIREISTCTEEERSVTSESLSHSNGPSYSLSSSSSSGKSTIDTREGHDDSSTSRRHGTASLSRDGTDSRLKEYQSIQEEDEDESLDDEFGALVPRCLYA